MTQSLINIKSLLNTLNINFAQNNDYLALLSAIETFPTEKHQELIDSLLVFIISDLSNEDDEFSHISKILKILEFNPLLLPKIDYLHFWENSFSILDLHFDLFYLIWQLFSLKMDEKYLPPLEDFQHFHLLDLYYLAKQKEEDLKFLEDVLSFLKLSSPYAEILSQKILDNFQFMKLISCKIANLEAKLSKFYYQKFIILYNLRETCHISFDTHFLEKINFDEKFLLADEYQYAYPFKFHFLLTSAEKIDKEKFLQNLFNQKAKFKGDALYSLKIKKKLTDLKIKEECREKIFRDDFGKNLEKDDFEKILEELNDQGIAENENVKEKEEVAFQFSALKMASFQAHLDYGFKIEDLINDLYRGMLSEYPMNMLLYLYNENEIEENNNDFNILEEIGQIIPVILIKVTDEKEFKNLTASQLEINNCQHFKKILNLNNDYQDKNESEKNLNLYEELIELMADLYYNQKYRESLEVALTKKYKSGIKLFKFRRYYQRGLVNRISSWFSGR